MEANTPPDSTPETFNHERKGQKLCEAKR